MSKKNADFYDLEQAGRISDQLLQSAHNQEAYPQREESPLSAASSPTPARFKGLALALLSGCVDSSIAPASSPASSPAPQTLSSPPSRIDSLRPLPSFSVEDISSWDEFAERALNLASADVAFVVDGQGLVVAATGPDSQSYAESIGARVIATLDQTREIDPAAGQIVSLEVSQGWVSCIRQQSDGLTMILVIRKSRSLSHAQASALASALSAYCQARS